MTTIAGTTQFWGAPANTRRDTLALFNRKWELSERDRLCFDCLLPDCNQSDPQCPFDDGNVKRRQHIVKTVHRQKKQWERELDEAVARILEERKAR